MRVTLDDVGRHDHAAAVRRDSPLLAPTQDRLDYLGPLPNGITVHLDAGYDSYKTRALLNERGIHGSITHKRREGSDPVQSALARRTNPCLAERFLPARTLL